MNDHPKEFWNALTKPARQLVRATVWDGQRAEAPELRPVAAWYAERARTRLVLAPLFAVLAIAASLVVYDFIRIAFFGDTLRDALEANREGLTSRGGSHLIATPLLVIVISDRVANLTKAILLNSGGDLA